jgi:hypothetical protein
MITMHPRNSTQELSALLPIISAPEYLAANVRGHPPHLALTAEKR